MSAVAPAGNTVILRPSLVAKPTDPFVTYQGMRLLRVGNFSGGKGGNSLLAVFNTATTRVTEIFKLSDFPGIVPGEKYAIRAFQANSVVEGSATMTVTVQPNGWEFFTATRVVRARVSNEPGVDLGSFGLTDKIVGAAAVLGQEVIVTSNAPGQQRVTLNVKLKALGKLGMFTPTPHKFCLYKKTLTRCRVLHL